MIASSFPPHFFSKTNQQQQQQGIIFIHILWQIVRTYLQVLVVVVVVTMAYTSFGLFFKTTHFSSAVLGVQIEWRQHP